MIKFALIGTGAASVNCAAAIFAAGAHICAVSDMDSGWAASMADLYNIGKVYLDYRTLLRDPEVEALCIYNCDKETVMEAAKAGKHIFWQMPVAMSEEELRQLQEIANRSGIKLQCERPLNADPSVKEINMAFETKRPMAWNALKRLNSEIMRFLSLIC